MDGRVRDRTDTPRSRELAEVEALAWLLDNSIAVPGTGGRRFGIDALMEGKTSNPTAILFGPPRR